MSKKFILIGFMLSAKGLLFASPRANLEDNFWSTYTHEAVGSNNIPLLFTSHILPITNQVSVQTNNEPPLTSDATTLDDASWSAFTNGTPLSDEASGVEILSPSATNQTDIQMHDPLYPALNSPVFDVPVDISFPENAIVNNIFADRDLSNDEFLAEIQETPIEETTEALDLALNSLKINQTIYDVIEQKFPNLKFVKMDETAFLDAQNGISPSGRNFYTFLRNRGVTVISSVAQYMT